MLQVPAGSAFQEPPRAGLLGPRVLPPAQSTRRKHVSTGKACVRRKTASPDRLQFSWVPYRIASASWSADNIGGTVVVGWLDKTAKQDDPLVQ